jgi:hypothetical protein
MRAPSLRAALVALAAAAVVAAGTLASREGPIGGGGAERAATTETSSAAGTTSRASLGTMSERLARLPAVAPGNLTGLLDFADHDGCWQRTINLATLESGGVPPGICVPVGGSYGQRRPGDDVGGIHIVDRSGRLTETVAPPEGLSLWGVTRGGVVFCHGFLEGPARIRRFGSGSARLPGCPLTESQNGLVFAGPGRRSILDESGRRLVALRQPLRDFPAIRPIGDALLAVDSDLYGHGRLVASYDEPDAILLGASRDGRVALLSVGAGLIVERDGTAHPVDPAVATRGGVVAPDGSRVLVQHDQTLLVVLDAATLRPVANLPLGDRADVRDWRSSTDG